MTIMPKVINMANEIKKETQERFKAHVQKYHADGFTLKQAKEEAEMVTLPGDRQMMFKKFLAFLKTLFTFTKVNCIDPLLEILKQKRINWVT